MHREVLKTQSGENRLNTKFSDREVLKTRKGKNMATVKENISIEGYESMTAEQKVAALESMSLPEVDMSRFIDKAKFDEKLTELGQKTKRIKELENAQLSDAERLANERKAFEEEKAQFNRERNATLIKGIFAQGNLAPEDYADLDLDSFEDKDKAERFANSIVKLAQAQRAVADESARNSLLGGKQPPKSGASANESATIRQQYADALRTNNSFEMARLIRVAQEKGISLN